MDWFMVVLSGAGCTGALPAGWNGPAPPVGDLTGESWTDHDPDIVRLVYQVLVEQGACGRCGGPLRPAVAVRLVVGACTPPRFVVTARCRRRRRHRHVAQAAHRRGGLMFGALRPA
jgi:hypothetical protein